MVVIVLVILKEFGVLGDLSAMSWFRGIVIVTLLGYTGYCVEMMATMLFQVLSLTSCKFAICINFWYCNDLYIWSALSLTMRKIDNTKLFLMFMK